MEKEFDLILFGATGFTGRLVAEHLGRTAGADLRWAIAGRDTAKLTQVHQSLGLSSQVQQLQADAHDVPGLLKLVSRTRAVITTVGPYQTHGEALVTACAEVGTDYLDLCGEPAWMAQMIPVLEPLAQRSGARIVFSCGFDSVPFDLGVVFLQDEAVRRFKAPLSQVAGRVAVIKGGPSGGTVASMLATFEAISRQPALADVMDDPFALTPGFRGPAQPDGSGAHLDPLTQSWSAPFVMAPINTKNVHRTNALRGHPWGQDFQYDERLLTGQGPKGQRRARSLARQALWQQRLLAIGPLRALLARFVLPKPGQGPDAAARERGRYKLQFLGQGPGGQPLAVTVRGDRDPGYGSTSKIVAETARCLLEQVDRTMTPGGVWTPGAAMGILLARRLHERAGLTFRLET